MKNLGIRGRITVLVVISALPALALTIYSTIDARAKAEVAARADLRRLAKLAAMQQEQVIQGARLLLAGSSRLLATLQHDRKRCREYFKNLSDATAGLYHSMGLFDPKGELLCHTDSSQGRANASDRRYFQLALTTRQFSVGEYQIGRVTQQQAINFGYPITDSENKLTGIAFIGLSLKNFELMAAATPLPEQGLIIVIDQNGVILARHPDQMGLAGEKLRNPRTFKAILSGKAGVLQSLAPEGVQRILAYESVWENPDGTIPIRVAVSMPLDVIFADANAALVRNLIGIVVATLFLLIGAWYGAERLVLRNIKLLLNAANRVRSGDLGVRTGLSGKDEELNQVGHAFDEMAQALQQRDAELKQALHDLHEQAITDPLTGLYNRRYVLQLLPRELKRTKRSGSTLAAIMIDLDHFKRVNDTFGHEAGDQVLMSLGTLFKDNSRGGDTACRYGGEEFLIILPETSLEGAMSKANDIMSAVKRLDLKYHGRPLGEIRASLGVALFPDHSDDADSLLRAADEAMYEAKGRGRDRIVVSVAKPASR